MVSLGSSWTRSRDYLNDIDFFRHTLNQRRTQQRATQDNNEPSNLQERMRMPEQMIQEMEKS